MTPVPCFLVVPTDRMRLSLRRYRSGSDLSKCPGPQSYHDAKAPLGELKDRSDLEAISDEPGPLYPKTDPRWPTHCACGEAFVDADAWQVFTERIWARADTGEENTLHAFGPGAMWDATWHHDVPAWCGFDGRAIIVKLPNGHDWAIDGRASNCTLKDDTEHRCWIRHGEPPHLTVDKNGRTCAAGAGSIASDGWHGFLRNGMLVE